jgi:hypothetical protein
MTADKLKMPLSQLLALALFLSLIMPSASNASSPLVTKAFSLSYSKTMDFLGANVDTVVADWRPRYDFDSWLSAGAVVSLFPLVVESRFVLATNEMAAISFNLGRWGFTFLGGVELWGTPVMQWMPVWGASVTFRWSPIQPIRGLHLTVLNPRLDIYDIFRLQLGLAVEF